MEEELKQYALQLKLQNPAITQEELTNKIIEFKNTLNVDPKTQELVNEKVNFENNLSVSQTLENRDTAKRKAIFKSMGAVPGNSAFGVLPDWAQEKMYNATIGAGEIAGGLVDFFDGFLSPVVAATGPSGALDLMTTISLADNIDEGLGNWARKHGDKIDLQPMYESLNKAKDLSVKKYNDQGNVLDVQDLIKEGRIGDAADLAASQAAFFCSIFSFSNR